MRQTICATGNPAVPDDPETCPECGEPMPGDEPWHIRNPRTGEDTETIVCSDICRGAYESGWVEHILDSMEER